MAGYCTSGDVVRYTKFRDYFIENGRRTHVTVDDLNFYIERVAFDIDAALASVDFELPVDQSSSPSGWEILRHLNAIGAASLAEAAIKFGPETTAEHAAQLWSDFSLMLDKILDGRISLIDVPGGPVSPAFSGSVRDELGRKKEPFFEREQVF